MGRVVALLCATSCGNEQVTQERVTDTDAATEGVTTGDDDPSGNETPSGPDDDDSTTSGDPMTSSSSPTDPSSATDSATEPGTGSGDSGGTTFGDTGFTTTGGSDFWCADDDLGAAAIPVMYSGSNIGRTDLNLGSCTDGANGDEVLVTWTAPEANTYYIDTIGSEIDTVLYVLDACFGEELACNDDVSLELVQSSVSVDLAAFQQILIVIDGYDSAASGAVELYINTL